MISVRRKLGKTRSHHAPSPGRPEWSAFHAMVVGRVREGAALYNVTFVRALNRPRRRTGVRGVGDFRDLERLLVWEVARSSPRNFALASGGCSSPSIGTSGPSPPSSACTGTRSRSPWKRPASRRRGFRARRCRSIPTVTSCERRSSSTRVCARRACSRWSRLAFRLRRSRPHLTPRLPAPTLPAGALARRHRRCDAAGVCASDPYWLRDLALDEQTAASLPRLGVQYQLAAISPGRFLPMKRSLFVPGLLTTAFLAMRCTGSDGGTGAGGNSDAGEGGSVEVAEPARGTLERLVRARERPARRDPPRAFASRASPGRAWDLRVAKEARCVAPTVPAGRCAIVAPARVAAAR